MWNNTWNTDVAEHFSLLHLVFDVRAAKRILAAKKRLMVKVFNPQDWVCQANQIECNNALDDSIDLTVPVIVASVTLKGGVFSMPIDGWHRIKKAISLGVSELPYVELTAAETKKISL